MAPSEIVRSTRSYDFFTWLAPVSNGCLRAADEALDRVRLYLRLAAQWKWLTPGQYRHAASAGRCAIDRRVVQQAIGPRRRERSQKPRKGERPRRAGMIDSRHRRCPCDFAPFAAFRAFVFQIPPPNAVLSVSHLSSVPQ